MRIIKKPKKKSSNASKKHPWYNTKLFRFTQQRPFSTKTALRILHTEFNLASLKHNEFRVVLIIFFATIAQGTYAIYLNPRQLLKGIQKYNIAGTGASERQLCRVLHTLCKEKEIVLRHRLDRHGYIFAINWPENYLRRRKKRKTARRS